MRLCIFLLLFITGVTYAESPLSVVIVPSQSELKESSISLSKDSPRPFYVVVTNTSAEPVSVWEYDNSWGYQSISFVGSTDNGKEYSISKKSQKFTKNWHSTYVIAPKESQVFPIKLDSTWEISPEVIVRNETSISMRAIFEIPPSEEASSEGVWVGRVESSPYKLRLQQ